MNLEEINTLKTGKSKRGNMLAITNIIEGIYYGHDKDSIKNTIEGKIR